MFHFQQQSDINKTRKIKKIVKLLTLQPWYGINIKNKSSKVENPTNEWNLYKNMNTAWAPLFLSLLQKILFYVKSGSKFYKQNTKHI